MAAIALSSSSAVSDVSAMRLKASEIVRILGQDELGVFPRLSPACACEKLDRAQAQAHLDVVGREVLGLVEKRVGLAQLALGEMGQAETGDRVRVLLLEPQDVAVFEHGLLVLLLRVVGVAPLEVAVLAELGAAGGADRRHQHEGEGAEAASSQCGHRSSFVGAGGGGGRSDPGWAEVDGSIAYRLVRIVSQAPR